MRFSDRPLGYRVLRGAKVGLVIAIVFSLWAALAFSLKNVGQREAMHLTLIQAMAAYLSGGLFGGAFAGAAFRMSRWAVGAFMLGFVANFPTTIIMAQFIASDMNWQTRVGIAVLAACIGGVVALYVRSNPWPS